MAKATSSHPPDEFDVVDPTAPRSPHRAPKTRAQRVVPFLVAIILGPLLAYVVVTAVSTGELPGRGGSTTVEATGGTVTPTVTDDDAEGEPGGEGTEPDTGEEADPSADEETAPEDEDGAEDEEPAAEPDFATSVMVLNSTGTAGLAGRASSALEAAGWTDVATGNYSGTLRGSTVFYAEDDPVLEASARAVAEELGIESVELDAEEATEPVTVVLEADYTP